MGPKKDHVPKCTVNNLLPNSAGGSTGTSQLQAVAETPVRTTDRDELPPVQQPPATSSTSTKVITAKPKIRPLIVRVEICPQAEQMARRLLRQKRKSQVLANHSKTDQSKMVEKARTYGFTIKNRCNNEGNPLTFCAYCKEKVTHKSHFQKHKAEIDPRKLHAYTTGYFTSGLRGPLHKGTVVQLLQDWVKADKLWANIDNLLACVGVGLVEERSEAMPIYDLGTVFKRGFRPGISLIHQQLLDANVEMDESSEDIDLDEDMDLN
ncbi:uncharacterized protein LOC113211930 [Frankliniella occidentalis]|uniref:Uncharacterized protein LOC113211930 n=1 Tax=Frankliniella occidentalis TaxID=133901 RepID=A0A6J1T3R5_FRAOC|nr:uncharacterized protein LOC113211930 [Frankliniella occidentalis]